MNRAAFYLLGIVLAAASHRVSAGETIRWAPDLASARAAAQQFGVPLMIHFYGDHCLPCELVDTRVFTNPEVISTLNRYFICARINASTPDNRPLAAQYQVHSWPTDVFISPDGKTLYQGVSPTTANTYMAILKNVAVLNRDRNVMLAAQEQQKSDRASQPPGESAPGYAATAAPSTSPKTIYAQSNASNPSAPNGLAIPTANASSAAPNHPTGPGTTMTAPDHATTIAGRLPPRMEAPRLKGAQPPESDLEIAQGGTPAPTVAAQMAADRGTQAVATTVSARPAASPPVHMAVQPTSPHPFAAPRAVGTGASPGDARTHPTSLPQRTSSLGNFPQGAVRQPSGAGLGSGFPAVATPPNPAPAAENRWEPAESRTGSVLISNPYAPASPDVAPGSASGTPQERHRADGSPSSAVDRAARAAGVGEPALGGFCPVMLATKGEWVEGKPEFAVRHRGKVYFTASKASMEAFLAHPDAHSPILDGYDPMVYLERGQLVEGKLEFGLHEQVNGRFLLFSSQATKEKYWNDFDRYQQELEQILKPLGRTF